jgi:hypothetical protein
MAFLMGFILVIVGLVVLAIGGVWGVIPDGWQWVGALVGGMGALLEIPGVLQMTIGRAKLEVLFDRIAEGEMRGLAVFMKNPQLGKPSLVRKSIWRRLGVKRESIESLVASFQIREVGSGTVLIPIMQARIYADDPSDEGSFRVRVPTTMSYGTSIMIAMWNERKKVAVVPGDRIKSEVELGKGIYGIDVIFAVDGEPEKRFRKFVVGDKAEELRWVG